MITTPYIFQIALEYVHLHVGLCYHSHVLGRGMLTFWASNVGSLTVKVQFIWLSVARIGS